MIFNVGDCIRNIIFLCNRKREVVLRSCSNIETENIRWGREATIVEAFGAR